MNDSRPTEPQHTEARSAPGASCSRGSCGCPSRWLLVAILLLFGAVYAYTTWLRPTPPPAVVWASDFDAALSTAAEQNKLVFVDFFASWCGRCKLMDREVWPSEDVAAALNDFVAVKIDVDRHKEIADRYRVQGLPTLAVLTPGGEVVDVRTGGHDTRTLIRWINSIDRSAITQTSLPQTIAAR